MSWMIRAFALILLILGLHGSGWILDGCRWLAGGCGGGACGAEAPAESCCGEAAPADACATACAAADEITGGGCGGQSASDVACGAGDDAASPCRGPGLRGCAPMRCDTRCCQVLFRGLTYVPTGERGARGDRDRAAELPVDLPPWSPRVVTRDAVRRVEARWATPPPEPSAVRRARLCIWTT